MLRNQPVFTTSSFARVAAFLLFFSPFSFADDIYIPPALQDWQQWVLDENDQVSCPFLYDREDYTCLWVSTSKFDVSDSAASFSIRAEAFAPRWLDLPGNDRYWPQDVVATVDGQRRALALRAFAGRPQVKLAPGAYDITARFVWQRMPNNIPLPQNSGIVSLRLNQQQIENPDIDRAGNLWLRKQQAATPQNAKNALSVLVFRLLRDENPAKLVTRIVLEASGEAREISTGQFLLEGFVPLKLSSPLPARIDENNNLQVQLKNGRWEIELTARYQGQLLQLEYQRRDETWPSYEVWAFEANRALRIVDIQGPAPVDPSQTNLPGEWQNFPAYQMLPDQTLSLEVLQRGDPTPEADKLIVNRELFLDFSGEGFTAVDRIDADFGRSWRLDTQPQFELGSVRISGNLSQEQARLITQSADGESEGFEVRQEQANILALSRIARSGAMPASGWRSDIKQLQTRLHLPPGWSLFAATGVDKAQFSWIARWNLWDIFLFLIIAVASFRLFGLAAGALAAVTLLFIYQRSGAPVFIWLNLVATMALLSVTKGKIQRWLSVYHLFSLLILLLIIVPFSVDQLRSAVYPQLNHPDGANSFFDQMVSETRQEDFSVAAPSNEYAEPELVEEILVQEKSARLSDAVRSMAPAAKLKREQAGAYSGTSTDYDPNAIVQTGPGVPDWSWLSARLEWNGPVSESEMLRLYLVPPWLNRIANVLAVVLTVLFAALIAARSRRLLVMRGDDSKTSAAGASALIILLGVFGGMGSDRVHADVVIDKDILNQLQQRLTRKADCLPECVAVEAVQLEANDSRLKIKLSLGAQDAVAAPLPAWRNAWLPSSVLVDGKPAVLWFSNSGQLHVYLKPGRHQVEISGALSKNEVELNFGLPLHNVTYTTEGWDLSGSREGYVPTGSVQLQRIERQASAQSSLLPDPVPPFVSLSRQLSLGLEWKLTTTLTRIAPAQGAISLDVPLIDGEAPLSDFAREGDTVRVNFGATQNQVSWQSTLPISDVITLRSAAHHRWAEVWSLQVSPIWHVDFDGLAPIKQDGSAFHTPVWMPYPDESLLIRVARPPAAAGESMTIDGVDYTLQLGQRTQDTKLSLNLRTSRGQNFSLALPDDAVLDALLINNQAQPLIKTRGVIDIPLRPGSQSASLQWHQDKSVDLRSVMPQLALGENVSNIRMTMQLPRDRWPLAVGGPLLGPAVLFWGVLLVVIIAALFLSRSTLTPLKFHHWFLLGLGICSVNLLASFIVTVWLFCVGARGRYGELIPDKYFKAVQVLIILLSVFALLSLLGAISMGLLSNPEMHISGNNSSAFYYRWYQDRIADLTPSAWVISVPLLYYRIVMLAWSLWLSVVLLNWLRWEWQQLQAGGFWQRDA